MDEVEEDGMPIQLKQTNQSHPSDTKQRATENNIDTTKEKRNFAEAGRCLRNVAFSAKTWGLPGCGLTFVSITG